MERKKGFICVYLILSSELLQVNVSIPVPKQDTIGSPTKQSSLHKAMKQFDAERMGQPNWSALNLDWSIVDQSNKIAPIVISEVNAETGMSVQSPLFIELAHTEPCLFKRSLIYSGHGPALDDYFGVVIVWNGTYNIDNQSFWDSKAPDVLPVIQHAWNFTGYRFANDSNQFVIFRTLDYSGKENFNVDPTLFRNPTMTYSEQTHSLHFWLANGTNGPVSFILGKTHNQQQLKEVLSPTDNSKQELFWKSDSVPLTMESLMFLKNHSVDMITWGGHVTYDSESSACKSIQTICGDKCGIWNCPNRSNTEACSKTTNILQVPLKIGEHDNPSAINLEMSLQKCGNPIERATPFVLSHYVQAPPTGGKENDCCTRFLFIPENETIAKDDHLLWEVLQGNSIQFRRHHKFRHSRQHNRFSVGNNHHSPMESCNGHVDYNEDFSGGRHYSAVTLVPFLHKKPSLTDISNLRDRKYFAARDNCKMACSGIASWPDTIENIPESCRTLPETVDYMSQKIENTSSPLKKSMYEIVKLFTLETATKKHVSMITRNELIAWLVNEVAIKQTLQTAKFLFFDNKPNMNHNLPNSRDENSGDCSSEVGWSSGFLGSIGSDLGAVFGWLFGIFRNGLKHYAGSIADVIDEAVDAISDAVDEATSTDSDNWDSDSDIDENNKDLTATAITTTATSTTTTTATANATDDICLIQGVQKGERKKRMIGETSDDYTACICIIEKFLSEIPEGFREIVSECGDSGDVGHGSQDLFGSPAKDLNKLIPLQDLAEKDTPERAFGSPSLVDAIMVRAGLFRKDLWNDPNQCEAFVSEHYICQKHLEQLGPKWETTESRFNKIRKRGRQSYALCSFPEGMEGAPEHRQRKYGAQVEARRGTYASRQHVKALFMMKKGAVIQMGTPLCKTHFDYVEDLAAEYITRRSGYAIRPRMKRPIAEEPMLSQLSDFADEPLQLSQSYQTRLSQTFEDEAVPSIITAGLSEIEDEIKNLFWSIARCANINHFYFSADFSNLSPPTKRFRLGAMRTMIDMLFRLMDPSNPDKLWQYILLREKGGKWQTSQAFPKLHNLLTNIATYYEQSDIKADKIHALALAAGFVTFEEMTSYIPGLKQHKYTEAKRVFARYGYAAQVKKQKQVRENLGPNGRKKVENFAGYLLLPFNIVSLPHGTRKMKMDKDGETVEVASVIRTLSKSRLILQYYKHLKESNTYNEYFLSKSTLERIMDACVAGVRKITLGLDNYTYLGLEAVDKLLEIMEQAVQKFSDMDKEWVVAKKQALLEAKHYIRTDFRAYLQKSSSVAKHCMSWALSDPGNQYFLGHTMDHEHTHYCPHCMSVQETIKDICVQLQSKPWDENELSEVIYLMDRSADDIQKWIAHQVRTVYQEQVKEDILEHLIPGTDVFITIDWAMKWLRLSGREAQLDWYGKRGISWHVSHVLWKQQHSGVLQARAYVHLFDQSKQLGQDVFAILVHVLKQIKTELPVVDRGFIRSDNGPHYHQSGLMASVHQISELTGIYIKQWSFSEAQSGKGPCDRTAAVVKNHLYKYIAERNKVTNSEEFLTAVSSGNGLAGTSFFSGTITYSETSINEEHSPLQKKQKVLSKKKTAEIPGISFFSDFQFDTIDGVKSMYVWRHKGIGEGDTIDEKYWAGKHYKSSFVMLHELHPSRGNWNLFQNEENENGDIPDDNWNDYEEDSETYYCPPERSEDSVDNTDELPNDDELQKTIYECPDSNCVKSFLRLGNLQRHLIKEDHKYMVTKETTMDRARQCYKKALEGACPVKLPPFILQQLDTLSSPPDQCENREAEQNEEIGWALKKKTKRNILLPAQIEYLISKYNQGEQQGKKFTGHDIEKQMRKERTPEGTPKFSAKEWLKWTTIDSFFSRETQRRRKAQLATETGAHAPTTSTIPEAEEEEGMCLLNGYEQLDPDLEFTEDLEQDYLYDDTLLREDDEIRESLVDNIDNQFNFE